MLLISVPEDQSLLTYIKSRLFGKKRKIRLQFVFVCFDCLRATADRNPSKPLKEFVLKKTMALDGGRRTVQI